MKTLPRILLLDDDDGIALLCLRMLQGTQLSMITSGTVAQALWLMSVQPFDLAICDIGLPDGDGLDFLARFKALCPAAPAIVITASRDPENERLAAQLGVKHFLRKPFRMEDFTSAVRESLPSGRP